MNPAFELLQFLVRSDNRVTVLVALTSEESLTRSELQSKTGIPRSTVSRILGELGDRELVSRVSYRYEVTPLGRFLAGRLQSVFDSIDAIQRLQTLLNQLSDTDTDLAFTDHTRSEILTPTSTDPGAPTRRFADLLHAASHVRLLVPAAIPLLFEVEAAIREGNRTFEVVLPRVELEGERDDAMFQQLRDVITSSDMAFFSYDGDIPNFAGIIDEIATVGLIDDTGTIEGYIETSDKTVCSWVEATVEAYQRTSGRINTGDLPP